MRKLASVWLFLTVMLLMCPFLQCESEDVYPTYSVFQDLKRWWVRGDYQNLRKLLGKRVYVRNLWGCRRDSYYLEQMVGILRSYFLQIDVKKFDYDEHKMTTSRGVVIYHYQVRETGMLYERTLYVYLSKIDDGDRENWFITAINEM